MTARTKKPSGQLVNQKDLASIFGVTDRTVRDWEGKGCPTASIDGKKQYNTADVFRWFTEDASDGAPVGDEEYAEAKKRSALAKAITDEANSEQALLDLAEKRELTVALDKVEKLVLGLTASLTAIIDPLPYRLLPAILGAKCDRAATLEVLKKEIHKVRDSLSNIRLDDSTLEEEQQEDVDELHTKQQDNRTVR